MAADDVLTAAKVAFRNFTAPTDDANFYPPKFKGWVGKPESPALQDAHFSEDCEQYTSHPFRRGSDISRKKLMVAFSGEVSQ